MTARDQSDAVARKYDLTHGYRLLLIDSGLGKLASIAKDDGRTILWTGSEEALRRVLRVATLN